MGSVESISSVVQIAVFASPEGWRLIHPAVESRFEQQEEAIAAARRLAHLECWRGRRVSLSVEEIPGREPRSFQPRPG